MMRFAREASRYFPACEIVELHHDGKVDFPSGTAKATAHEVASGRGDAVSMRGRDGGMRGVDIEGVPIHSVRLPGLVAHQEVIFGGPGQTLSIRHDSMGRDSFMPGVLLAVRKVMELDHVVLGLDSPAGVGSCRLARGFWAFGAAKTHPCLPGTLAGQTPPYDIGHILQAATYLCFRAHGYARDD
jgi:hypothetical protein